MAKRYKHLDAEINIIPLLDVLLVLVAVLLMLTPFMSKAIHVELPTAEAAKEQSLEATLTIEIHQNGTYWHQGFEVLQLEALAPKLKGSNQLRIQADKGASFAAVTKVMDAAAAQGIQAIEFAVRE